jgi:hypothetical protein
MATTSTNMKNSHFQCLPLGWGSYFYGECPHSASLYIHNSPGVIRVPSFGTSLVNEEFAQ